MTAIGSMLAGSGMKGDRESLEEPRDRRSAAAAGDPIASGPVPAGEDESAPQQNLVRIVGTRGELEQVPGIGRRRAAMLRATLAGMLARSRAARSQPGVEPSIDLLLNVDREYREKAARGALPKIAPRRFHPSGEAWLPILHTERADWHFTAVFSNTTRAHELGRVRDGW